MPLLGDINERSSLPQRKTNLARKEGQSQEHSWGRPGVAGGPELPEPGRGASFLLLAWPPEALLVLLPWHAVAAHSQVDTDFLKVMLNFFTVTSFPRPPPRAAPSTPHPDLPTPTPALQPSLLPCAVSILGQQADSPQPSPPRAQRARTLCICSTTSGLWCPPSHIPHPPVSKEEIWPTSP